MTGTRTNEPRPLTPAERGWDVPLVYRLIYGVTPLADPERDAALAEQVAHPDRVDFWVQADNSVLVIKFRREAEHHRDVAIDRQTHVRFDWQAELSAYRADGYTVREWPDGARAFKGRPWPIRSASAIQRKRYQQTVRNRDLASSGHVCLDYAYDM